MTPARQAALALAVFFAAAAGDLALRSRSAFSEGARHEAWLAAPGLKKAHFEALHAEALSRLERRGLPPEEAAAARLALEAARDLNLSESSAKQAYVWYKTAAGKFRSPLNPWAAKAGSRLPAAREAWKAELVSKGLKPDAWILDPAAAPAQRDEHQNQERP